MMQDIQALCVGRHDAVLNTIVDHLDEVTSTIGSTPQVTLLGSSPHLFSSRCTRCCVDAGGQGREDRVEMLNNILFTANHQTIAALEAPTATACSAVHIVDTFRFEFGRTANIIVVVRIATVYDDVTGSKVRDNGLQRRIHRGSRHHQPDSAGRGKFADEVGQRCGSFCDDSSFEESLHGFRVTDVTNDRMTSPYQPLCHVGAHTASSDHSELHSVFLSWQLFAVRNCMFIFIRRYTVDNQWC